MLIVCDCPNPGVCCISACGPAHSSPQTTSGPRIGSRLRPDYALAALLVDAGANCKVAHSVADGELEVSVFQMLALRYCCVCVVNAKRWESHGWMRIIQAIANL